MRADAEWCQSEGFKNLLAYSHATIDDFDKGCFVQYFFRRYVLEKAAPYWKTSEHMITIVHGPLPGSMDTWAPNHYMIRLYDNRTPRKDRMGEDVIGKIQHVLKLRDPVWTVSYSYLHWTDVPRTQPSACAV